MSHKIKFSELEDKQGEICKIISINKETGKIKKDGKASVWDGHVETKEMLFHDFPSYLSSLPPQKAIILGTTQYTPVSIVVAGKENPPNSISRTKKNFSFAPENQLLFFDYDSRGDGQDITVDDFIERISCIIPQFQTAAKTITYSTSSFIYDQNENKFNDGDGFHIFFIIKVAADIERFVDVLSKRLWLHGYGYIFIDKTGGMHVRTIFDKSVFKTYGIIFEAGAICIDGLCQKRPAQEYRDGDVLDTTTIQDLTDEENRKYEQLVEEAKKKIKPDADKVSASYEKRETQKLIDRGVSKHKVRSIIQNRNNLLLMDEEVLTFDDGTQITAKDLLERGEEFNGRYLFDSLEPEAGPSKAQFFWNNNENPIILLFLHGGRVLNFSSRQGKNKNSRAVPKGLEPTYPVDYYHSPEEAEGKLQDIVRFFLKEKKHTGILFEAGGGKTQTTIKVLAEEYYKSKRRLKVAYVGNSHEIAEERVIDFAKEIKLLKIIEKILGGGVESINEKGEKVIIGQGFNIIGGFELKCKLPNAHELTFDKKTCDSCLHNIIEHSCPYLNQYGLNTGDERGLRHLDNFRIYQQAHLFQPSVYDYGWKPDVLVIDEDIIKSMVTVFHITKDKNPLIKEIIEQVEGSLNSSLEEVLKKKKGQIKKQIHLLFENKDTSELNQWQQEFRQALNVLHDHAVFHSEKHKEVPSGDVWIEGDHLYIGWIKKLHKNWNNIPILYLDASGNEEIISRCMGIDFEFHKIRCKYQDNVEVIQVENYTISKRWIREDPNNLGKLEKIVQSFNDGNTGFISYKTMNDVYVVDDDNEEDDNQGSKKVPFVVSLVGDEAKCGWFGNVRGLNRFEDDKNLLVIGSHNIGDNGVYRNARVIYRNDNAFLSKDTTSTEKTIRMKDGNHLSLQNWEYVDDRMQKVSEHYNKSETYQAVHRKRLVWGNQPKRVIILTKYVQDITISRTIIFESLLKGKLQFEDFIKRVGIWKHNDSKGMSAETGIPYSTV
ncbi:MAG: hypothetical protein KJ630_13085, partial [Proteobacteria bacterium]|nr:hypothetical protein [Pseudomonadota bacterium]